MRRKAYLVCLVAVLLLTPLMVSQASAALMTYDVFFTASDFSKSGGTVPVDPVVGSFTIAFDPTLIYPLAGTTTGITLNTLNIALGSALSFSYNDPASLFAPDTLLVGGLFDGPATVQFSPATDDFWLFINNFTTAPTFKQVGYAQVAAGDNLFFTPDPGGIGTVEVVPVTPPVPLPGTLPLVLSGLGALVAWRRRSA